jgi:endonuclease/exonuclease/phosphatase family metal-dependent hydrolase
MRNTFCLLLIGLLGFSSAHAQDATPVRVMTYNIRYNNTGDGENAWPHRKDRVAGTVRFYGADLVGMQEALRGQIDDLAAALPGYAWIGVGRDDGRDAGEFSPIFYREDRFELLETDTFWLSETPEVVASKSWDAAITRVVTWGHFEDKTTGKRFYHFNTHFDHRGEQARTESARLHRSRVAAIAGATPLVVTGDFNFEPSAEGYGVLTAPSDGSLTDTIDASAEPHHGPAATCCGFSVEDGPTRRIDYVFIKNGVEVVRHGTLTDTVDKRYGSDHLAVLTDLLLP